MTSKITSSAMANPEAPATKSGRKRKAAAAAEPIEPAADAGNDAEPKPRKQRATKVKDVPASVSFNPEISMRWEGEPEPDWHGTLDALVRMNELDLTQDAEFIEEMRTALREHGEYAGGGGAAPVYVLRVVEGVPDTQPEQARLRHVQDAQPAEGEPEPATKPKRQKRAQAPVPAADATQAPGSSTETTEPAEARGERQARKERGSAKKAEQVTLAQLSERFLAALEAEGKSDSTIGAYRADLGIAQRVLGADADISGLTAAAVRNFNDSPEVTVARSGMPKALPSILRTRRVLRLALAHAVEQSWLASNPAEVEPVEVEVEAEA